MKLLPKISLTLNTLTVLGLTGAGTVDAGTTITNLDPVLNQPDVTKVGTDGYYLYNFYDPSNPLRGIGTTTGKDAFGVTQSPPITGVGYLSQSDLTTNSSNGSEGSKGAPDDLFFAKTTNPNGNLGVGYLEAAGYVANFTVNANVPASFTVGYVIDGTSAPPSIVLADLNSINPGTNTFSVVSAQNTQVSTKNEVDYYLFNITGAVNGETFTFYAKPNAGQTQISGMTFATVPETSSSVGLGILLSVGGLSILLRKRTLRAKAGN